MTTRYRLLVVACTTFLVATFFVQLAHASLFGIPTLPDPVENTAELWALLRSTWRTGGAWPAIVLAAYAGLLAARVRVSFLRRGKAAAWSAASLGLLGAVADMALGVGSWSGVLVALLSGVLLVLEPAAKPLPEKSPT